MNVFTALKWSHFWFLLFFLQIAKTLIRLAQADLSLRWAHKSRCWFCHVAAQIWWRPSGLSRPPTPRYLVTLSRGRMSHRLLHFLWPIYEYGTSRCLSFFYFDISWESTCFITCIVILILMVKFDISEFKMFITVGVNWVDRIQGNVIPLISCVHTSGFPVTERSKHD